MNDVNCFALGEYIYGQGKSFSSLVAVAIGTGLGAGILINRQLYSGNNCGAGEIGSLPYQDRNFEFYASSPFFTYRLNTTPLKAHFAALEGDQEAIKLWSEYGFHLGNALQAVLHTYDPEAIILGGSISKAYPFFEKSMWKSLAEFPYPDTVRKLKIIQSKVDNIALLGAASLVEAAEK